MRSRELKGYDNKECYRVTITNIYMMFPRL